MIIHRYRAGTHIKQGEVVYVEPEATSWWKALLQKLMGKRIYPVHPADRQPKGFIVGLALSDSDKDGIVTVAVKGFTYGNFD